MAQIPFRANLQTTSFPLLSELSGQTIIVPAQDQTFIPGVSPPATAADGATTVPADRGNPQIYYGHNVMPSTQGFQSIGYDIAYTGIDWQGTPVSPVEFKDTKLIQGGQVVVDVPKATNFKTYLSVPKAGTNSVFTLDPVAKRWKLAMGAPAVLDSTIVTVATVNGISYIFFSLIGCYLYDNTTNTLVKRTLAGLAENTIIALIASNGYLVALSETAMAWSSVVNVEDFTPSDVSGAGGGQVQEARGKIVTAAVTSLGFIIYTEANAVSVIYSGNADFPWNLKNIPSSGGVASPELVSSEQAGGFQQIYSTNGLQQVGHTGARTVFPQITDFIAGKLFEDYDIATNKFTSVEFDWVMRKGLSVIADRYILVSYGLYPTGQMTHAVVLDIAQNRMGKLKLTHNSSFELRSLLAQVTETPRGSLAFLQANGDIKVVDFNFNSPAEDSVLFLGKYQYVRQRMLELHQVNLENVKAGADFKAQAWPALDGKNYQDPQPGYLLVSNTNYRRYTWEACVGSNISLLFTGRFNLISLILWFSTHGSPNG